MIFSILPIFGHILFIFFGGRYANRQSISKYHERKNFKFEEFSNTEDKFLNEFSKITSRGVYKGDIEFITSGTESFKRLFADLRKAEKFIHLNYYIIKSGEIYDEVIDILKSKVQQGIEVRLIVDDFGRWAMNGFETQSLKKSGINVSIFGKVHFPFLQSENGYRTHRKLTIIDGKIAYTGGENIGDEYASLSPKFGKWVDANVRITGKYLRSLSLLFLEDWYQYTGERLEYEKYLLETNGGNNNILLIEDSPEIIFPVMQNSIIRLLSSAKKSITITTPYFVPTNDVISAIRTASLAGIKVKVFIPGLADKKIALQASRFFASEVSEYGVEIYETNNMFLHSKIGIIDNKYAYIGTVNLDIRSLYSQFEMINLFEGKAVKDIVGIINEYQRESTRLSHEDLKIS